jgi:hypothetical protein
MTSKHLRNEIKNLVKLPGYDDNDYNRSTSNNNNNNNYNYRVWLVFSRMHSKFCSSAKNFVTIPKHHAVTKIENDICTYSE